jgi:uncharacterized protein
MEHRDRSSGNSLLPIAPWWHTVLVLAPIAIASIASAYQHGLPTVDLPGVSHRLSSYHGIDRRVAGSFLSLARAPTSRADSGQPGFRALAHTPRFFQRLRARCRIYDCRVPLVGVLAYFLGASTNRAVANIPPTTVFELLVFVALAASAGSAEELIFR